MDEGNGRQRLSIFSALRLPPTCDHLDVPEDLSPVNTFRLVFAGLDGRPPELLPKRTYFVDYEGGTAQRIEP